MPGGMWILRTGVAGSYINRSPLDMSTRTVHGMSRMPEPTKEDLYKACREGKPLMKIIAFEEAVFKQDGQEEDENSGYVKAVIATLEVIDRQGDRIMAGAIGEQKVTLSAYGHSTIRSGRLPIGRGRVYEEGKKVYFEGYFFMDEEPSAATYRVIKKLSDIQEWSFSLHDIDYTIKREDRQYIFELTKITVKETSPVLRGAGIDTRTVEMKDDDSADVEKEVETLTTERDTLKSENETLKTENQTFKDDNAKLKAAINRAAESILSSVGGDEDAD